MGRRLVLVVLVVLLGLTVMITLVVWPWGRPAPTDQSVAAVARRDVAPAVAVSLPAPVESAPAPLAAEVEVPELPTKPEVAARLEASRLEELVEELVALWEERPASYHAEAPAMLMAFAGATELEPKPLLIEIDRQLVRVKPEGPVRGALAALRGTTAPQTLGSEGCLVMAGSGSEDRRGARIGLVADWGGSAGEMGLRIDLHEEPDMARANRPGARSLLMLPLARMPDDELSQVLMQDLYRIADDLEQVVDRWLAVFALGTAVEQRGEILDVFTELLFDQSLLGHQVHKPILFVLTRSREPHLVDLAWRYLREGREGAIAKDSLRLWLGEQAGDDGLDALAEPLLNGADAMDAMFSLGGIQKWVTTRRNGEGGVSIAQEDRVIELASGTLRDYGDDPVRLVAVHILAFNTSQGVTRMEALRQVFERDAEPLRRRLAAQGLARTSGELQVEALAILRARQSVETDEQVLAVLKKLLGD